MFNVSHKKGAVVHIVTRLDGTKELFAGWNTLTGVCFQRMAAHMADAAPGKELFTHVAYGTGITLAESENNNALETEIHRKAFDSIYAGGATLFGSVTILGSDIGAGSYAISEVGLYDASAGGNLIARQLLYDADDDGTITFSGAERFDIHWGIINQ